jgi:hypothetical protein
VFLVSQPPIFLVRVGQPKVAHSLRTSAAGCVSACPAGHIEFRYVAVGVVGGSVLVSPFPSYVFHCVVASCCSFSLRLRHLFSFCRSVLVSLQTISPDSSIRGGCSPSMPCVFICPSTMLFVVLEKELLFTIMLSLPWPSYSNSPLKYKFWFHCRATLRWPGCSLLRSCYLLPNNRALPYKLAGNLACF